MRITGFENFGTSGPNSGEERKSRFLRFVTNLTTCVTPIQVETRDEQRPTNSIILTACSTSFIQRLSPGSEEQLAMRNLVALGLGLAFDPLIKAITRIVVGCCESQLELS